MNKPITDPEELGRIAYDGTLVTNIAHTQTSPEEWASWDQEGPLNKQWFIDGAVAVRNAVCPEGYEVVPIAKQVVHVIMAGGYCETVYADGTSDVEEMVDVEGDEDDGESDE